jgi:hypothetical protein
MTAKQKAAREKFKKVVAEAGKLRKKNPSLTQAQAVKQAWAISYSKDGETKKVGAVKKKSAPKKSAPKKSADVSKMSKKQLQDALTKKLSDSGISKDFLKNNFVFEKLGSIKKKKAAPKKVAAIKIIEKGESKSAKAKATYQQVRTKKGTFKGLKKVGAMDKSHKDTKSHNVNIRVVSGIPPYKDPDAAREIELYADNDSRLYFSRKLPILKNLQKKFQKGQYNVDLAAKLWMYYINDAMQRYNKEYGSRGDKWSDLLSVADRKLLAIEYAKETLNEFQQGNFIV